MGFFKSLGNKLKRVVSIKNALNVVSGKFADVGKDILRVATTEKITDSNGKVSIVPNGFSKSPVIMPTPVTDILNSQGQKVSAQIVTAIADNSTTQTAVDLLTKVGLQAFWTKHKNWIIGLAASILVFIVVKMTFFRKNKGRAKR